MEVTQTVYWTVGRLPVPGQISGTLARASWLY